MRLTAKLADKIAKRYAEARAGIGSSDLDRALAEVIRRQGGLCAALNDDARRDLILTLGDHRRANERTAMRSRARYAASAGSLKIAAE